MWPSLMRRVVVHDGKLDVTREVGSSSAGTAGGMPLDGWTWHLGWVSLPQFQTYCVPISSAENRRMQEQDPEEVAMKVALMTMMLLAMAVAGCTTAGDGGAQTGAAPERYMGERSNVNGTWNGATSSSSMLMQRIKQDSANGASSGGADTRY